MFVHAPERAETRVTALVLWDDPDLAFHAVEICREIEKRQEEMEFQIQETEVSALERSGDQVRDQACESDLLVVALQRTLAELPDFVRDWFQEWARARERRSGALAILRPADHVDGERFRRLVREPPESKMAESEQDRDFRRFLEDCARRAHVELFWGCLESDLEDAIRGLRILQAPDPVYPPELRPVAG